MSREAFEKFWEQVKQPLHQMGTVSEIYKNNLTSKSTANEIYDAGYQTCEAEQSKRIAELEAQLKKFKDFAHVGASMLNELEPKYKKLQAQNADLVEALKLIDGHATLYLPHYKINHNVFDAVKQALAK